MKSAMVRWFKFNLVGAAGIGVQFGALWLLTSLLRLNYMLATAMAVEAAVIHNLLWHVRFTWSDREAAGIREFLRRLLRFHLANGAVSLVGNLLLMRLLVGRLHFPLLAANCIAISCCSIINFLASDQWVFSDSAGTRKRAPSCDVRLRNCALQHRTE